jgi:hypothetical protein
MNVFGAWLALLQTSRASRGTGRGLASGQPNEFTVFVAIRDFPAQQLGQCLKTRKIRRV